MYQTVEDIFNAFEQLKVLIVGDVMLDAYIWGRVERISPEAPIPIVQVHKREKRLGGAANVALNIQALGATPLLCAVIGEDRAAEDFEALLQKRGIPAEGMVRSRERVTTVKERIIAGSQQMLRVDTEDDELLAKADQQALMQRVEKLLPRTDVVIFQDYDKGVLDDEIITQIIDKASTLGIPTAVDPKKRNFLHYRGASLFKPNLKELREGLKAEDLALHREKHERQLSYEQAVAEAAARLRQLMELKGTFITLSEKGVYIDADFRKETRRHLIPAHIRKISDVSGAGDTVISIAALCLALNLSPRLLAELSNLGGGIVCEYTGVVPIEKERLLQEALRLIDPQILLQHE
jgi:rfaE bifunctional protein kinase chain/domain